MPSKTSVIKPSRKTKKKSVRPKKSPYRKDFKALVGRDVYDHWLEMLKTLVPQGRTHRLSVVVAGMIHFTWSKADHNDEDLDENKVYLAMEEAFEDPESDSLGEIISSMFLEAGVKSSRINSKGHGYSISEDAVREFYCWDMMPWE